MNLTVTDLAQEKLSALMEENDAPAQAIRVFAQGGGCACSGPQFGMAPALEEWQAAAPFIGLAVLYTLPMLFLTIWPANLHEPGSVCQCLRRPVRKPRFHPGLRSGISTRTRS